MEKTVYMDKYQEFRNQSSDFTDHLEHLEQSVINWGVRKYKTDKAFAKDQGYFMDLFDPFPEGYQTSMVITWMFTRILMDQDKLLKYARASKDSLFPGQNQFLKLWKKQKPFWSLFTVEERLAKQIFRIKDPFEKRDIIICSSSLENLLNEEDIQLGLTPVISALFPVNEDLVVSYGIIRRYKGWLLDDIVRLYYYMSEELGWCDDFSSFVLKYYTRFFQMDQRMEIPPVFHKDQRLERVFREACLPDFQPEALKDRMDILENEPYLKLTPKGQEGFPYSEIIYNRDNQTLIVQSMSRNGYDFLAGLLKDFPVFREPLLHLSYPLYSAVREYMDLDLADEYWEGLFDQGETEDSPELDDLNTLIGEALAAMNKKVPFDIESRGWELGMPEENIRSARDVVSRVEKKLKR